MLSVILSSHVWELRASCLHFGFDTIVAALVEMEMDLYVSQLHLGVGTLGWVPLGICH